MTWEFRVGQKVVCVCGDFTPMQSVETAPKSGGIYTIRTVEEQDGDVYLRFDEIKNPEIFHTVDGWAECMFLATKFRPLVTDTQSWLADILAKPPVPTEDEIAEAQIAYAWSSL